MTGLYFVIAIAILQAIVAGLAKKAQEKRNLQSKGGASATPQATDANAPASRQVVRAPSASSGGNSASRPVAVSPSASRSESGLSRAQVDAQYRARAEAQARAQAEAQARARARAQAQAQAQARAQAQAKAQAQARAQAQAQAQAQARARAQAQAAKRAGSTPSALQRASGRAQLEERDALHSRERVQESLDRVLAAERKVADALPGHHFGATARAKKSTMAASLREMLGDKNRVREAFILTEVLGRPRSMPEESLSPFGLR